MTLTRTIATLLGASAIMICVVVLRAETTRIHYEISRLDQDAMRITDSLREAELELARWRSPTIIRERIKNLRIPVEEPSPSAVKPASPKKSEPRTGRPARPARRGGG